MAGQGYRLYNTGDVLTAQQVNQFLQEQTVMVFASAAARTTALSGVLAEGMMSYLTDTDLIQYYNGSAWTTVNTDQTPLTTKGDLFTYSTTDARLAVGNNGESLVADSSATTGLRWQGNQAGGRNAIINGGMDFWQRGTSFTSASVYTADRWFKGSQTTCTVSRQTASLDGFLYSMRVQRDSGSTNTVGMPMFHNIETQESLRFAGKTVVLSFYAKAGANYSPTSSLLNYILYTGTGTDQARTQSVAFTGEAQVASGSVTLTTSWQRFSFTASIGSTATEICFAPQMNNTGTAGANDWFEITGVQLEIGSIPTTFSRAGGTLAGELQAAQRYYQKSYSQGTVPGTGTLVGGVDYQTAQASGTGTWYVSVPYKTTMRTEPTITVYDNSGTSGKVYKGGSVAVSTRYIGDSIATIGTTDTTSANELFFQYVLSSEL